MAELSQREVVTIRMGLPVQAMGEFSLLGFVTLFLHLKDSMVTSLNKLLMLLCSEVMSRLPVISSSEVLSELNNERASSEVCSEDSSCQLFVYFYHLFVFSS